MPTPQAEREPVPNDVVLTVLAALPPNELAFHGRRVFKAAAAHFDTSHYCTVALGQPLNDPQMQQQMRSQLLDALPHMSFRHKLSLMVSAAASGCEANLEVAWEVLQPCLFPGFVLAPAHLDGTGPLRALFPNPAVAAIARAPADRVAPTLDWLVSRCPLLVQGEDIALATAAAKTCDLGGLQLAEKRYLQWYGALRTALGKAAEAKMRARAVYRQELALAAARSGSADSRRMVQWALNGVLPPTRVEGLAAAAAGARDRRLLQWLRQKGVRVGTSAVLLAALRHGDFATVRWLREQGRAEVPVTGPNRQHDPLQLCEAAAGSCLQAVQKLVWLAAQGLKPRGQAVVVAAAAAGQVEAVRQLHERWGVPLSVEAWVEAAGSGSLATAAYLKEKRCPISHTDAGEGAAYLRAAVRGDLAMVRWLAGEGGCGRGVAQVAEVIEIWGTKGGRSVWAGWGRGSNSSSGAGNTPTPVCYGDTELLAAVQLLAAQGWPLGNEQVPVLGGGTCDAGLLALIAAIRHGDLPLVRWLHQQGCSRGPWRRDTVVGLTVLAGATGGSALLEWVWERWPKADTKPAIAAATKAGNREAVAWLNSKRARDDRRRAGGWAALREEMLGDGVPAAVVSRLDACVAPVVVAPQWHRLLPVCLACCGVVAITSARLLSVAWSRGEAVKWARALVPLKTAQ